MSVSRKSFDGLPVPKNVKEYLREIGRKGGSSRSAKKRKAAAKNAAKMRKAKLERKLRP